MSAGYARDPLPFESCQAAFERAMAGRRNIYEPGSAEDLAYAYGIEVRESLQQTPGLMMRGVAIAEDAAYWLLTGIRRCAMLLTPGDAAS